MMLRHLPNLISIVRIVLVFPVVYFILSGETLSALLVFFIAGVSDGIDGFLAKQFRWQSRLGSILDPIADKLLLVCSFAAAVWVDLLPWWLLFAALLRDVLIVGGGLAYHYTIGKFELAPSFISKLNTVMQIVLLVAVLSEPLTHITGWLMDGLLYLTLFTVVLSGLDYVIVWGRKAFHSLKKAKN